MRDSAAEDRVIADQILMGEVYWTEFSSFNDPEEYGDVEYLLVRINLRLTSGYFCLISGFLYKLFRIIKISWVTLDHVTIHWESMFKQLMVFLQVKLAKFSKCLNQIRDSFASIKIK